VKQINAAAYLLYFVAALNAGLGILAEALNIEAMLQFGFGFGSVVVGFVYGVLGFLTLRRSFAALAIAIVLYVGDGLFSMVMSGKPGGIVVRLIFTMLLIRGAQALWSERSASTARAST
jgi:hypothetical protein